MFSIWARYPTTLFLKNTSSECNKMPTTLVGVAFSESLGVLHWPKPEE